jgi:hypothetical protein
MDGARRRNREQMPRRLVGRPRFPFAESRSEAESLSPPTRLIAQRRALLSAHIQQQQQHHHHLNPAESIFSLPRNHDCRPSSGSGHPRRVAACANGPACRHSELCPSCCCVVQHVRQAASSALRRRWHLCQRSGELFPKRCAAGELLARPIGRIESSCSTDKEP